MLKIVNLYKNYGDNVILDNYNYEFEFGSYAIIGANGVGKSTLLSILAGIEKPDSGYIFIDGVCLGINSYEAKKKLGYVPDKTYIYPFLTGKCFLQLIMDIKNADDRNNVLSLQKLFKLDDFLNVQFSEMSLGTQRKFMITAAFIGNPKIILMDEPTNGLDFESNSVLVDLVIDYSKNNVVIFSTHDKSFIEETKSNTVKLQPSKD